MIDEIYAIRIFKEERGLDINAADARYVQRPYTVLFSDNPPELGEAFTGVLKNGELWYDTQNLQLFCLEQQCVGDSDVSLVK